MFRSLITTEERKLIFIRVAADEGDVDVRARTSHVMTPLRVRRANCLELHAVVAHLIFARRNASLSRRMSFDDEGCENFTHVLVLSCGLVFSLGKGGDDGGREENFLLICIIWDICLISC